MGQWSGAAPADRFRSFCFFSSCSAGAGHRSGLALVVIIALFVVVVGFIAASWPQERTAAWLFVPYAAWLAFATVLNASIFTLK